MTFIFALLLVASLQCAYAQDDPDCWVFRARGRAIAGNNDRVHRNIASEDECAQACVSESGFDCASMEYKAKFSKCFLSTATRESAGDAYGPNRGMTYRERVVPCGGAQVVDPCSSDPCQNDGVCSASDLGGYTCTCTDGFEGPTCDQVIEVVDPCSPDPCQNDGVCSALDIGGYICTCTDGFEGPTCDQVTCPPGFTRVCVADDCFGLSVGTDDGSLQTASPSEAVAYCAGLGAFLAEPHTEAKWQATLSFIREHIIGYHIFWLGGKVNSAGQAMWEHYNIPVEFTPADSATLRPGDFHYASTQTEFWNVSPTGGAQPVCERAC